MSQLCGFYPLCIALVGALVLGVCSASNIAGLPPTAFWPQPQQLTQGKSVLSLSNNFVIKAKSASPIVQTAIERYTAIIASTKYMHLEIQYPYPPRTPAATGLISTLLINVVDDRDESLQLGFDESYTLNINAPAATLHSNKVWGVIRGLETFSQALQWNGTQKIFHNAPASITDAPRYPWRGYLLDTARHYLKPSTIKKVIAMMAQVKFNVFHWHLIDAEAFPFEVESRPELSLKGSWTPSSVYSASDVADIVDYAKTWGVRVVPELDTPGHTFVWAASHPEVVLNCSQSIINMLNNINIAALDMTNPATYEVVADVIKAAASVFSDDYLHLGGDEVIFTCLDEFPRVKEWMKQQGMNTSSYVDLIQFYSQKLAAIVNRDNGKNMLFWQEAFFNAYKSPTHPKPLPPNTIFQVWINPQRNEVVSEILNANMPVLISSGWYLDQQTPSINGTTHYLWEDTFLDFYSNEIETGLSVSPDKLKLIQGGEVWYYNQWGEQINDEMLWARMMPRAAGAAERLWSPKAVNDPNAALHRILSVRCRLAQRGFPQSGMRPDYCEMPAE